jgi:hypothetical protein
MMETRQQAMSIRITKRYDSQLIKNSIMKSESKEPTNDKKQ